MPKSIYQLSINFLFLALLSWVCCNKPINFKIMLAHDMKKIKEALPFNSAFLSFFFKSFNDKSFNCAADKMNVLYKGVDNPITVSVEGLASDVVTVFSKSEGVTFVAKGKGKYDVRVTKTGNAIISVSGGGDTQDFIFRVKLIPDPVPRLGLTQGHGNYQPFNNITDMYAELKNFDFDVRCQIQSFELVYIPKREDAIPVENQGGAFDIKTRALVRKAKIGDMYSFMNIKARCPGDEIDRNIGTMSIYIR